MIITLENVLELAREGEVYCDTPLYSKDGRFRMLDEDVIFQLSDNRLLEVRKGVYWDENSVPYILQWAFPKSGLYAIPALVHDALYFDTTTSQVFADSEYRKWLIALESSTFQIECRYYAVRLCGGSWWRKNLNEPGERTLHNRKLITIK